MKSSIKFQFFFFTPPHIWFPPLLLSMTGAEGLEKMASFGVSPNMTVYLMGKYHMGMTTASNVLFLWTSATNFMPIVWALISDSFLGQFYTIGFGSIICSLVNFFSFLLVAIYITCENERNKWSHIWKFSLLKNELDHHVSCTKISICTMYIQPLTNLLTKWLTTNNLL